MSVSLSHQKYLTHNIGSASALPILPKTIENRKRDCAWGCAWGINTTWENLQIEKPKSVRWAERTPSWFVLFDLQNWRWIHTFPCQKFAIGNELTLSLAKDSHFSFLPSHFPSLPSRRGYHCGAENRNEFTLSIAKISIFRPLCSPSFKWHEPRDEWSKTQDKWSNPAQSYFVLPIEKMNQINTKNCWK